MGSTFQRGRGVGVWLGGLFRRILPYVTSEAKALGKETLRAGIKVVDDVANSGVNFKEAVKSRAKESGRNLKRKAADKISEIMKGAGYKTTVNGKRRRQSRKKRTMVRTAGGKKKTNKRKTTAGKKKKKKNSCTRTPTSACRVSSTFSISRLLKHRLRVAVFYTINQCPRSAMMETHP